MLIDVALVLMLCSKIHVCFLSECFIEPANHFEYHCSDDSLGSSIKLYYFISNSEVFKIKHNVRQSYSSYI